MIISTKGRYALRVILDLAQHKDDGYQSLREIANRQGISPKYLEMIVALLNKGDILKSQRGKDGGYCLGRDAGSLTVNEIVQLTEGSLAAVACLEGAENPCQRASSCLTLPVWKNLDRLISLYLSGITVQDVLDGTVDRDFAAVLQDRDC